jgi:regulator of protease activity HflC (stomatin/prohibitin superfamily)
MTRISEISAGVLTLVLLTGLVILGMWGCPRYKVYSERKDGEAQLARASYSRQVAIVEADAKMKSATLLAQADSMRAIGVAASNRIIAASITEQYIQWKWVDEIKEGSQIIYVPSGSMGIPILEANRLSKPSSAINQQP